MEKSTKIQVGILSFVVIFSLAGLAKAATVVNLGTADNFSVLSGSTITNTGPSVVSGDIGLSPGTSVTGFPPGTLNGAQHLTDAAAGQAQADLTTAYNNAAGQSVISTVSSELGGTTKTAGVYDSAAGTFGITGTLTLDAQGDPNAVFVFKAASTLITTGASSIVLVNGAQACNVFWQVGSSATLGTNSTFKGNLLAQVSATLTTGVTVEGRILARNGAVTLDTNTISKATCAVVVPTPTPTPVPTIVPTTTPLVIPEPTVVPTSTPVVTPTPTPTPTTTITITPVLAPVPVVVPTIISEPEIEVATVIVPKLPETGIAPEENSFSWSMAILAGTSMLVLISLGLVLRKRIS